LFLLKKKENYAFFGGKILFEMLVNQSPCIDIPSAFIMTVPVKH
jgi:hypothetical protein